jgi:DNA-binding NarL/FixJ family response regulator
VTIDNALSDQAIRVMLVDDHQLFRQGTAQLLETEESICIVGVAESVRDALETMPALRPDVVLVDISMPDANGFHFMREAAKHAKPPKIMVLSGYDDIGYMRNAFNLGAFGYLSKTCSRTELVDSIRHVHAGGLAFSADVLAERGRAAAFAPAPPTKRELEVLSAVRRGLGNKQIAAQLYVSERTVHFHIGNIFSKLGVTSRLEAVVKGRESGWISD